MRNVRPDEVVHFWANSIQDSAHNAKDSISFYGNDLFSYGTIIARHVTNKKGDRAVEFTTESFSATTTKHQSMARSGANHIKALYVPCISSRGRGRQGTAFECWLADAKRISEKIGTARKPVKYLAKLQALYERVSEYCEFYKTKMPRDLAKVLSVTDAASYVQALKDEKARKDQREARARKAQARDNTLVIDAWREGLQLEGKTYKRIDRDYLRIDRENDRIETSQSVRVPVALARRLFVWLVDIASKGGCEDCNYEIMNYQVRRVTADYVQIGCHTIYFDEVKRIGDQLGWIFTHAQGAQLMQDLADQRENKVRSN